MIFTVGDVRKALIISPKLGDVYLYSQRPARQANMPANFIYPFSAIMITVMLEYRCPCLRVEEAKTGSIRMETFEK